MQLNRIIALVLIVICFISAALGITRRRAEDSFNMDAFKAKGDRLELVNLDGVINSSRGSSRGAMAVRDRLIELRKADQVKGVLLVINTPGGTVGASKEVYEAVKQLRDTKPVVVSMLDQATSGGYYVASGSTKIYANPGTLTGSIGVIISGLNFRELFNKVGVEPQTIKTGPYKDIFSPYKQISEPERQLLQELLQNSYQEFISDVAKGRNMDLEVVRKLADGRIYTGKQAKENGLVDALGTAEIATVDLRKQVREKFKIPDSKDLPLERGPSGIDRLVENLLSSSSISLNFTSPLFNVIENVMQKFVNTSSTSISSNDPPVLLMPSWFQ